MTTPTARYATAVEALDALVAEHIANGDSVLTRVRITTRHSTQPHIGYIGTSTLHGGYVSRQRVGGDARPLSSCLHGLPFSAISRIDYSQARLRTERGPLFVAEGA